MNGIMEIVGCRPNYLKYDIDLPTCSSKDEMANFTNLFFSQYLGQGTTILGLPKPCREIQNLRINFKELNPKNLPGYHGQIGKPVQDSGFFVVSVAFTTNEFKEIKQIQAYSLTSLIGNAGGYIGLLMGYAICQLPQTLLLLFRFVKKAYLGHFRVAKNDVELGQEMEETKDITRMQQQLRNNIMAIKMLQRKVDVYERYTHD